MFLEIHSTHHFESKGKVSKQPVGIVIPDVVIFLVRESGVKKHVIPGLSRNPGGNGRRIGYRIHSGIQKVSMELMDTGSVAGLSNEKKHRSPSNSIVKT